MQWDFQKSDKSPGSDGYINEFYKAFSDQMTSLLVRALADVFESGELPVRITDKCYT